MKKMLIYLLLSIPLAFALQEVIERKYEIVFWGYFIVMGVSASIAKLFGHSENKSTFVKIAEHLGFISVITLFMWCCIFQFLKEYL